MMFRKSFQFNWMSAVHSPVMHLSRKCSITTSRYFVQDNIGMHFIYCNVCPENGGAGDIAPVIKSNGGFRGS